MGLGRGQEPGPAVPAWVFPPSPPAPGELEPWLWTPPPPCPLILPSLLPLTLFHQPGNPSSQAPPNLRPFASPLQPHSPSPCHLPSPPDPPHPHITLPGPFTSSQHIWSPTGRRQTPLPPNNLRPPFSALHLFQGRAHKWGGLQAVLWGRARPPSRGGGILPKNHWGAKVHPIKHPTSPFTCSCLLSPAAP